MNSTIQKQLLCIAVLAFFIAPTVHAQEKQVLSVTPPLFQVSAVPGDIWQSSVKVVNGNPYPLTIYTEVVNFEPVGENGQGKFIPVQQDTESNATLADWININRGPIVIQPEQTTDITFFAEVPENAAPGGHYSAIMVSTEEPKNTGGLSVLASQAVTSLLFLRIEGDVIEEGGVREFSTRDSFLDTPNAEFLLRFENKGNVHLQPRGNILITNMWGTERGTIPINYQTQFGNVLPKTIRSFSLAWKSDFTITDIGRYEARVTLGYGESGMKTASAVTHFWVIPVKWTLITIGVCALFIWLIVFMVRAYVRRMLELAGVPVHTSNRDTGTITQDTFINTKSALDLTRVRPAVSAPLRDGVLDLRTRLNAADESKGRVTTIFTFLLNYRMFFISVALLIGIFVTVALYIGGATKEGTGYEVMIQEGNASTTLTRDEVDTIVPKK
jgi:hypothetical protein